MKRDTKGIERARTMQGEKRRKPGRQPPPRPEPCVLDGWADKWMLSMRIRSASPGTTGTYRRLLGSLLRWCRESGIDSPTPLAGAVTLDAWLACRAATATPGSMRAETGVVRRFLAFLVRQQAIPANPLQDFRTGGRTPRPVPVALPAAMVLRLLEAPDTNDPLGVRDRAMLELFYATGLRRAELAALSLSHVEFESGTIRVRRGKGGRDRVVPAGRRALGWAARYLREVRPLLAASGAPDAPFFVTGFGGGFSPASLGHLVRRYLDEAGYRGKGGPHLLRHACATHMLEGGANLPSIQRMLGHSRLDTTAIYTHVSAMRLRDVHARCHPFGDLAAAPEASPPPAAPRPFQGEPPPLPCWM